MKKKSVIIISSLGIVAFIIGIFILINNSIIKNKNKITIIDATYSSCGQSKEKFYEDDKYVYYFPCVKSQSMFVKFENGNKMLIVDALDNEMVTINELIDAGLDVQKKEK